MIITLKVSVGESEWGADRTYKEVEVKTENPYPCWLPWDQICHRLVKATLEDWGRAEDEREQEKETKDATD